MVLSVLGGVPPRTLGIGPELVHRLVEAMGGTSEEIPGDAGGWRVRLPRQHMPVVGLEEAPRAGEAPAMDLSELAG